MTNLQDVLEFIQTASIEDRAAIRSLFERPIMPTRQSMAAATLSQIRSTDPVQFTYDTVFYKGTVEKINRTTATVKITEILGTPRNRIVVGAVIRVGASILARG